MSIEQRKIDCKPTVEYPHAADIAVQQEVDIFVSYAAILGNKRV